MLATKSLRRSQSGFRLRSSIGIVLITALVMSCGSSKRDQALGSTLEKAVASASPGATINMGLILPGDWTRLVVFPAYTPNLIARETLGFDFDIESTPSQSQDGVNVVVLATDTSVVTWFIAQRDRIDFDVGSQPLVFQRSNTVFRLVHNEFGDPLLMNGESGG